MARVNFSTLYRKKGECMFVIFSKSWFLKLPDKGMESCETLKAMLKKRKFLFSGSVNYQPSAKTCAFCNLHVHSAIFYVTRDRSKRDLCNKS